MAPKKLTYNRAVTHEPQASAKWGGAAVDFGVKGDFKIGEVVYTQTVAGQWWVATVIKINWDGSYTLSGGLVRQPNEVKKVSQEGADMYVRLDVRIKNSGNPELDGEEAVIEKVNKAQHTMTVRFKTGAKTGMLQDIDIDNIDFLMLGNGEEQSESKDGVLAIYDGPAPRQAVDAGGYMALMEMPLDNVDVATAKEGDGNTDMMYVAPEGEEMIVPPPPEAQDASAENLEDDFKTDATIVNAAEGKALECMQDEALDILTELRGQPTKQIDKSKTGLSTKSTETAKTMQTMQSKKAMDRETAKLLVEGCLEKGSWDIDSDDFLTADEWNSAFDKIDKNQGGAISRKQWHENKGGTTVFDAVPRRNKAAITRDEWASTFKAVDEVLREWRREKQDADPATEGADSAEAEEDKKPAAEAEEDKKPEDKPPAVEDVPFDLKVIIVGAKGLRNADWAPGQGVSDPYVTCQIVGKPDTKCRTKVVANNLNPIWNHMMLFAEFSKDAKLKFEVWDKDVVKKDDALGGCIVDPLTLLQFYGAGIKADVKMENSGAKKGQFAYLTLQITKMAEQKS